MKRIILFIGFLFCITAGYSQRWNLAEVKAAWASRVMPSEENLDSTWNAVFNQSGDIRGTGTVNYFPKFTASSTIGNSLFRTVGHTFQMPYNSYFSGFDTTKAYFFADTNMYHAGANSLTGQGGDLILHRQYGQLYGLSYSMQNGGYYYADSVKTRIRYVFGDVVEELKVDSNRFDFTHHKDFRATTGRNASWIVGGTVSNSIAGRYSNTVGTSSYTNVSGNDSSVIGGNKINVINGFYNTLSDTNTFVSTTNTSSSYPLKLQDSGGDALFYTRGDGVVNSKNGYWILGTKIFHTGNSTSTFNLFGGVLAGNTTVTGNYLTSYGFQTMPDVTTSTESVAFGSNALRRLTTGQYMTALGKDAMTTNSTGSSGTAVGYGAANLNTKSNITAIGAGAAFNNDQPGGVYVGYLAGFDETGANKLYIDAINRGSEANARAKALLYGVFDADPANQSINLNALNVGMPYIPAYANNAAAVAVLGVGKLYYTDTAGEYIVKLTH